MEQILIIGAGPAGLTAAYKLCQAGYKPIILEETQYIGGLSRTHKYKGNNIDLGGHRFFTRDKEVLDFWKTIMPEQGYPAKDDIACGRQIKLKPNGPDPEKEDNVFLSRQRISRILFRHKFYDYPVAANLNTFKNLGLGLTLKIGFGFIKSVLFKREEKSLEDFYINRFGKPLYEMFFEKYTEKLWGIHPSAIDPSWGAQRVKEVSILSVIKNSIVSFLGLRKKTKAGQVDSFFYPKRGPGQLYELLAEKVQKAGGEILLNSAVTEIKAPSGHITEIKTANGKIYANPKAVFSTMPIKDLINSIKEGSPDNDTAKIAAGLAYRDYTCVSLIVPKLKIKNETKYKTVNGLIPDNWIYLQDPGIKAGRLQIFNNWSPYLPGKEGSVLIALEYYMQEGDNDWNMSDAEFIELAKKDAEKIGFIDASSVEDAVRVREKKVYPAYSGTYAKFEKVKKYLDGIDNLYCMGRNGQHRYNNMDHSILTAFEAVKLFIKSNKTAMNGKDKKSLAENSIIDKSSLWAINTKQEYHEDKTEK